MADLSEENGNGTSNRLPRVPSKCRVRLVGDLEAPPYFRWKAIVDRVLAAILLVLGIPVITLLLTLIRLTSRGPGLYRQARVGKDGKTFMLYKLRTMKCNAEEKTGPIWSGPDDPRVTTVGRVLRKLHLDEFPQLLNVLKGDMSLVGPRPERPEFVYVLAKEISGYLNRLAVRPGITGLAQVNFKVDTDLDSVRRKLALDLEYIQQGGLLLDMRIFLCTLFRLLRVNREHVRRIAGLERQVAAPHSHVLDDSVVPRVKVLQETLPVEPSTNGGEILNALTVDVEDYFQVSGFENVVRRDQWDQWDSRVVVNTHRILKLLDRYNVRATFFVLGWVAQHHPQLVREIHHCGHEVASHGYWHRLIYDQPEEEFRRDLQQTRDLLVDVIGEKITVHRAPSFSITKQSLWALEILVEEGFLIDTSIYPTYHDRYGIPDAEPRIHRIVTPAGPLWEFPPTVAKFARVNIPVSGGGYFRLYPAQLTLRLLSRVNQREKRPFMFYIHPWELDPEQPRIEAGSRMSRFRHYVNLTKTEERLGPLLQEFRFGPVSDVIGQAEVDADTYVADSDLSQQKAGMVRQ